MYADTINRIRSSYQQDLDDLRGLLDGDLVTPWTKPDVPDRRYDC